MIRTFAIFFLIWGRFFYIPDSLLKNLCGYLENEKDKTKFHITANEGNAISLGAGYHLATGKIPVCFLQNSGLGNLVNPLTSLTHKKVYSIPTLLIIGWRGEPNVKDEPQHIFQGEITEAQLKLLEIPYLIVDASTSLDVIGPWIRDTFNNHSSPAALLIRKNSFLDYKYTPHNIYSKAMSRESALFQIATLSKHSIIISTTGKTSRELYETRSELKQEHNDFLTVGAMGHTSSIALGVALAKPNQKVICLDGDGSLLMHMGSLAIMAAKSPSNLKYILLNNSSHESVGGQPTIASEINFKLLCDAFSINDYHQASKAKELELLWDSFYGSNSFSFLELKISSGSRPNLGRPKTSPIENKLNFQSYALNA